MYGDKKIVRSLPSGTPPVPSPFFPGKKETKLPPEQEWLRPFLKEMAIDMAAKTARMIRRSILPLYQFPPFKHTVIDMFEHALVNAGATEVVVLTLTIPQNIMARIRFYGQDITAVVPPLPGTEWLDIEWTFRVNGAPLEYYDRFLGQRGAQIWPAETTIILDGADVFEIVATNTSANNYFCWALIRGWQWSVLTTELPDENVLGIND